jgi:hypothetical protein
MPAGEFLYAKDLIPALEKAFTAGLFAKLVFYMEVRAARSRVWTDGGRRA